MNCESRNDHCHHPNNHGFDFFYGLPFTNFNDCKPGAGKGVLVDVQETLWQISALLTLASLTLLAARASGLLRVSWTLVAFLAAMSLLSFAVWFVPFELLRTWNCIIMRNGEVVEQPLKLETLNARLMSEAERFVERSVAKRHMNRDYLNFFFTSVEFVHVFLMRFTRDLHACLLHNVVIQKILHI